MLAPMDTIPQPCKARELNEAHIGHNILLADSRRIVEFRGVLEPIGKHGVRIKVYTEKGESTMALFNETVLSFEA